MHTARMILKCGPLPTNPHDETKSTNLNLEIYLDRPPKKMRLSIYSSELYQGVMIPIFGNRSIGRWSCSAPWTAEGQVLEVHAEEVNFY